MIGKALKYMRHKKNLSQEQLAKQLDLERSSLSGYETGRRDPDFHTIEKITNLCDYEIVFVNKKTKDAFKLKEIYRKD